MTAPIGQAAAPLDRAQGGVAPATWRVVPESSRAEFVIGKRLFFVKHLQVPGRFGGVTGTVTLDGAQPSTARVELAIDATTVDTDHARRDTHLRNADFFDVEQHPAITFVSRTVEPVDAAAGRYRATGDLTIRTVTHSVTLDVQVTPPDAHSGQGSAHIIATTVLNRHDLGLTLTNPVMKVADEARVTVELDVVPQ